MSTTQTETTSGVGAWKVTWENHRPIMVELWTDPANVMIFGMRIIAAPCALCGKLTECFTAANLEHELCDNCLAQAMNGD